MTRPWLMVAAGGWLCFFVLAFCAGPEMQVDIRFDAPGEGTALAGDGQAADGPVEPVGVGHLSVVDSGGKLVGVVVARTHRQLENNELFDAVQVYRPDPGLFFSVRMATGEVLRPGKIFFTSGNCSGTAAVRANCPECLSGFDLAFRYKETWYRVPGGVERETFKYASYVAEEGDAQCTGHGNSSTQVYPLEVLGPLETMGGFQAPLRFVWGP